ncbi:carbonic anhydrase family protein [Azospira inquinata]|uniref:Carbonic anhydrase family protein n=1 Tax=Azospira inquinata TaxID=2785627 RepID=A0A975SKD1_9RHOO|nr:carbonic anhydrase family protein [Azospira inquinata]QWT46730.1 carbonic anhydrase family protein [Azospira inquinata]QWT47946.1 carbonic anhydrase family protein [Azospira inquinata]
MPFFRRPRLSRACCHGLLGLAALGWACAAQALAPTKTGDAGRQWDTLSTQTGKQIDIDRSSIKKEEAGRITAWGRMVLNHDLPDAQSGGSYRSIEVLGRYDCSGRTYATLKRIYVKASGEVLREEEQKVLADMPVHSNTLDDKVLRTVCRPTSAKELRKAAMGTAVKASDVADALKEANDKLLKKTLGKDKKAGPRHKDDLASSAGGSDPKGSKAEKGEKAERGEKAEAADPDTLEIKPPRSTYRAPQPRPRKPVRHTPPRPATPASPTTGATDTSAAGNAHGASTATADGHGGAPHWDYEGANGPENWANLSPDFHACADGHRQSPIDIRDGIKVDLPPIRFNYAPSHFQIVDNGHTLQATLGNGSLTLMGKPYVLSQIHFHHPAEEKVNGQSFPLVAHLVHRSADNRLAVVAVLFTPGKENPALQTLWDYIPLERNAPVAPPDAAIDLNQLLPDQRDYYTYMGSLTTPPCTEGVLWLVLKQPVEVSPDQLAIFARLYPANARPIQPRGDRLIKESR